MTKLIILILLSNSIFANDCVNKFCSVATNNSTDLKGQPDTRPNTWGDADYAVHKVKFNPPIGYRVRVHRVYGDFVAWPIGHTPKGTFAGVLWGLQSTQPDGSIYADLAADNTFVYVQHAVARKPIRIPVNYNTSAGGLLGPDHTLISKVAVWLNNTGLQIHMEPSFVVVFKYEPSN